MHTSRIVIVALAWVASVVFVSAPEDSSRHSSVITRLIAYSHGARLGSDCAVERPAAARRGHSREERPVGLSDVGALGARCADRLAGPGLLEDQLPGAEDQSDEPARDLLQRHGRRSDGSVADRCWNSSRRIRSRAPSSTRSSSPNPASRSSSATTRVSSCHVSEATQNVPGLFVGSVFPSVNGTTMYGPAYTTDHRSPFELRWGGWFVTGTHQRDPAHGERDRHRSVGPGGDGDAGDRSRHEPERPLRHDGVSLTSQRHRRAARAGASGADAEPDHAPRMGGARRRAEAQRPFSVDGGRVR